MLSLPQFIKRYFEVFSAPYKTDERGAVIRDYKLEAVALSEIIPDAQLNEIRNLKDNDAFWDIVNILKIKISAEDERDFKRFPDELEEIIWNL